MKRRCRRRVPSSAVVPAENSEGRDPYSAAYRESRDYGSPLSRGRQTSLPLYPGKIRDCPGGFADLVEQLETVFAQNLVVHIDGNFFEESIDERAQLRHGAHGGGKVFLGDGGGGFLLGDVDRFGQSLFFRRRETLGVGTASVALVVLLLLDAQDVRGALDARQQVLAVVAVEEFSERRDAADDQQQIILAFEREHGAHQIVPVSYTHL